MCIRDSTNTTHYDDEKILAKEENGIKYYLFCYTQGGTDTDGDQHHTGDHSQDDSNQPQDNTDQDSTNNDTNQDSGTQDQQSGDQAQDNTNNDNANQDDNTNNNDGETRLGYIRIDSSGYGAFYEYISTSTSCDALATQNNDFNPETILSDIQSGAYGAESENGTFTHVINLSLIHI